MEASPLRWFFNYFFHFLVGQTTSLLSSAPKYLPLLPMLPWEKLIKMVRSD